MTPLLAELAEILADVFDDLHVQYAFGGALANNAWGIVRATQDVDCLVSVPALKYQQLADRLNAAGCVIRSKRGEAPVTVDVLRKQIEKRKLMEVYWQNLRAELFVPIVALQDEILRRAVLVKLERRRIRVTTAEDLIVLKMVFRRPKDLDDVRGMLYAQRNEIDLEYLEEWATKTLDDDARQELDKLVAEYVESEETKEDGSSDDL